MNAVHRSRHTALLFVALFAAQSAFFVLVSTLPQIGGEFHVRTEVAGQLGALSGVCGLIAALWMSRRAGGPRISRLLGAGTLLLLVGCLFASLANSFVAIALAQCVVGSSMAMVATASTAAAFAWPSTGQRARVLAWSLLGPPAAWVFGSPLIGAIADRDWRAAWLLPIALCAVVLTGLAIGRQPTEQSTQTDRLELIRSQALRRWAAGELLAFTGWNAVLTFASTLLVEEHGLSYSAVGLFVAATMSAYFPATLFARRSAETHSQSLLLWLALAAVPVALALGALRAELWSSALLMALLAAINGARGFAGNVRGQQQAPGHPIPIAGARTAILQAGGILGAALGGAALALGGWTLFGMAVSAVYLGSALLQEPPQIDRSRALRLKVGSAFGKYGNSADVGAQQRI